MRPATGAPCSLRAPLFRVVRLDRLDAARKKLLGQRKGSLRQGDHLTHPLLPLAWVVHRAVTPHRLNPVGLGRVRTTARRLGSLAPVIDNHPLDLRERWL